MEFYSIQRILNRSKGSKKLIWSKIARSQKVKDIIKNQTIRVDNKSPHSILRGCFFDFSTINALIKYLVDKNLIFNIEPEYLETCSHTWLVDYSKLLQPKSSGLNISQKYAIPNKKIKNFKILDSKEQSTINS